MIELMSDGRVLQELKKQLYQTELYDKLDTLTSKLESIITQLTAKDDTKRTLETTVHHLERQLDVHEQYSRRPNLRIQVIPEDGRGEDVESKVISVVNEKMGFNRPLRPTDIERSHRLGRVVSGQERPRAVIVRNECATRSIAPEARQSDTMMANNNTLAYASTRISPLDERR